MSVLEKLVDYRAKAIAYKIPRFVTPETIDDVKKDLYTYYQEALQSLKDYRKLCDEIGRPEEVEQVDGIISQLKTYNDLNTELIDEMLINPTGVRFEELDKKQKKWLNNYFQVFMRLQKEAFIDLQLIIIY